MPENMGKIHNHLMNNMIERGYMGNFRRGFLTFIQIKQKFIEPVKLCMQNLFGSFDDYQAFASIT